MNVTLLLGTILAIGAPALKDKDVSQEIYGTWELEEPPEEARLRAIELRTEPYRWRFNRNGTWQVFKGDKEIVEPRGFKFNPKADPPTLDLNTPPTTKLSRLALAIYLIEDDCLTICCAYPDQARPNRFDRTTGKGDHVQRFRRVKD